MPLLSLALGFIDRDLIDLLELHRADGADLGVGTSKLALRVEYGVDVQTRS